MSTDRLLQNVDRYYTEKVAAHGPTPRGVDWNSPESQRLRFEQFDRLWRNARHLSVNDLGCGYGALLDHLLARGLDVDYLGIDVSERMLSEGRAHFASSPKCSFVHGSTFPRVADYCVASGVFNVKVDAEDTVWLEHLFETLQAMNAACSAGFAFNCLTKYSDPDRMRADLYYADPLLLFDHCKRRFSKDVALLHDYGLFEFTIVVRNPPHRG